MNAFTTELPHTNDAPAKARSALSRHLPADLDASIGATLRLLVSELVTNSVRHSGTTADGDVAMDVTFDGAIVRVAVRDPGGGFERTSTEPRGADGGYGLFLVEKMAARWGIEGNGETCVWFELDVREAA